MTSIQRLQELAGIKPVGHTITEARSDLEDRQFGMKEKRGYRAGTLGQLVDLGDDFSDGLLIWGLNPEEEMYLIIGATDENSLMQQIVAQVGEEAYSAVADEGALTTVDRSDVEGGQFDDVFVEAITFRELTRRINREMHRIGAQQRIKPMAQRPAKF